MAQSLPSSKTIIADVPEPKNFRAEFFYNFFQPDERINDSGTAAPEFVRKRPSESFDADFIQSDTFNRFTSRYIKFNWNSVVELDSFAPPNFKISDNLDKIHEEQDFISDKYTNIVFQDTAIDKKMEFFVKKLAREQRRMDWTTIAESEEENPSIQSLLELAKETNKLTLDNPDGTQLVLTRDQINPAILTDAIVRPDNEGFVFTDKNGNKIKNESLIKELKTVSFFSQINNKLLTRVLDTLKDNSFTMFADEAEQMQKEVREIQNKAVATSPDIIDAKEYNLEIPQFIDYYPVDSDGHVARFQVLGYYIEKEEITSDGETIVHSPIIVENPTSNTAIDIKIKYGSTYRYSIRSVALFETQAIENETDENIVLRYLVSSKISPVQEIECTEDVAPPPPANFNIRWDAKEKCALLEWYFPTNPQRDIKQWQILRRSSIEEPFELIKVYDFDDSVVKIKALNAERPQEHLIKTLARPKNYYHDYSFDKDSKYIYAVCSVDARGFSSNYSMQFEVSFDRFKNKLNKKLISASGAPKAYPNYFLLTDTFVDTIKDSGHKQIRIVFDPEYLSIVDSNQNDLKLLRTEDGSSYQLSIINVDLQEQKNVSLKLLDKRKTSEQSIVNAKKKRLLTNRARRRDRLQRKFNLEAFKGK